MTRDEWRDELVRQAMAAVDAADAAPLTEGGFIVTARGRALVFAHLRERMAQAAQRIADDADASFERGVEAGREAGFADGSAQSRWDLTP